MKVLGISAYYHDSAAALIVDGVIKKAAQEERFTRKKHDPGFPKHAIRFCLQDLGASLKDIDAVVYYEKPFQKFDRILETYISEAPWGFKNFVKSFPAWIKHKLFLRFELTKELKRIDNHFDERKILFSEHHLSHAASAFYPSPFKEALVVTFDGVGEWATTTIARGSGSKLEMLKEIHFPHSLGFLYSAITAFLGFKVNSGEYKVMGLAPYGEPRFFEVMSKELIEVHPDGSYSLNLKYFEFLKGERMHSDKLTELLKLSPRRPEAALEQVHMDLAASLQKLIEDVIVRLLTVIQNEFSSDYLCLAGGVALNCVANSKILESGLFKDVWVQPAAGDAGGSVGAALAASHLHFNLPRATKPIDETTGMSLGPKFSTSEIEKACEKMGLPCERLDKEALLERTVEALSSGQVVGWFQGPMEFGPRALGARSILADARHTEMQKRLNQKIKFRESFRPFAPIVLEEDLGKYFEWQKPSPYMMFVAPVKKELRFVEPPEVASAFGLSRLNFVRSKLPAITHLDYSARLQTVSPLHSPKLYDLLQEFKKATGCSVLVNTSFNVRGEPIVCSPKDAIGCFLATDMDILVMEDILVVKSEATREVAFSRPQFELD